MQNSPQIAAEAMQRAHALAQNGDLAGAANICRTVLIRQPVNVYALFMLGSIESQFGQFDEAARHLGHRMRKRRPRRFHLRLHRRASKSPLRPRRPPSVAVRAQPSAN